jgi:hypothetical protein
MKKVLLITFILVIAGLNPALSIDNKEKIKPNPIPSFNFLMSGNEVFQEYITGGNSREKRDLHIKVTCTSHSLSSEETTVWVFKGDGIFVLGPYTVSCGETLVVPVDNDKWGAVVQSESEIYVDIWFSKDL